MDAVDVALLLLRVAVGVTIALHGYNKVFRGGKLKGTAGWFESMGVRPGWLHARLAAFTEVGAGLGFAAGLLTPLTAAGIVGLMVVAGVVAHAKNGFFIFRPGEGWEYVMVLAVAAVAVGGTGPGQASLDHAFDIEWAGWSGLLTAALAGAGGAGLLLATSWRPRPRTGGSSS